MSGDEPGVDDSQTDDLHTDGGESTVESVATECETVDAVVDDRIEGVVTMTLNRPDARNVLSVMLRVELKRAPDAIGAGSAHVVVLTDSDEVKAFVVGADVTELRECDMPEQREASKRPRVYERVDDLRQSVIARVNGHALGGGCELMQACDVRIAHERSKLDQPEINLGIVPGGGGTQRLACLVGEGHITRLVLMDELVSAEEATDIGLVEEVHGDETFDERVYEPAELMATKSPVALEFARKAVKAVSRTDLEQGIEYETELFAQLFGSPDKDEGIDALLEDREPEWHERERQIPQLRRSNYPNGFETAATIRRELAAQARALVSRREHDTGSGPPASEPEIGDAPVEDRAFRSFERESILEQRRRIGSRYR